MGPWPVGMCALCQVLLRLTTAGAPRVSSWLGAPTHSENLTRQLSGGAGGGGRSAGLSPGGWPAPAPEPCLPGCRQVWGMLRSRLLPCLATQLPPAPHRTRVGTLTKSGKLRGLPFWEDEWRKGSWGGRERGAAPGAQRGRTAATQVVYVHIQFITFIENRKPHT